MTLRFPVETGVGEGEREVEGEVSDGTIASNELVGEGGREREGEREGERERISRRVSAMSFSASEIWARAVSSNGSREGSASSFLLVNLLTQLL